MRKTVSRLQQDKNLRILGISGIPTSTHENLSYMMTKTADIMKINDFNSSSDIDNIYRVKPKDSNNKITCNYCEVQLVTNEGPIL